MTKKKTVRKTRRKHTRKAGEKKPIPGWIILLIGMLSGLILAVLAFVQGWVPRPIEQAITPVPGISSQVTEKDQVEDVSDSLRSRKKDYDFYSVLPEMEIVIPEEELIKAVAKDSKEYSFVLQIASFKNKADADELKAKIAFLGQIAYIQSIEVNQTKWHRVRLGPFNSGRTADSEKRKLEKNGYSALVLKEIKPQD
ncbi:MAG: SPOR domain-containing protein [Proteobacteria bacterium]|nr:SPOR domain-containing protein [Pseudomonadota bacterium]